MSFFVFYLINMIVLPPLILGIIRKGKARVQNRRGPSIFQPYRDLLKLFRKGETVSETTSWLFRWAPVITLATVVTSSFMIPWLGVLSPVSGDLFLIIYLLALGKFATALAALDSGSAFGGLGAGREATISVLTEPCMLLALAALAVHSKSSALAIFLSPTTTGTSMTILVPLVLLSLIVATLAELSRMPIDDPTTHLELTMIHEALILENSGRNLALVEAAVGLKTCILLGLIAQVALLLLPPQPALIAYLSSIGLIFVEAGLIAIAESVLVKLRWSSVPSFMLFGLAVSLMACLLAAIRG